MPVLVDTSVWIDYFRNGTHAEKLDSLIDKNLIVINDLILAELVPSLKVRRAEKVISLLYQIKWLALDIQWKELIELQVKCLKKGVNGIGIPDLIIAQNAMQNGCVLYSHDDHFKKMKDIISLQLIS